MDFKEIDDLKKRLDSFKPIDRHLLDQVRKYWRVGLTYSSNAIEGNTLTETETKVIIEDGLTVAGKTIREINEAVGHNRAMDFLFEVVDQDSSLSEETIKKIHEFFFQLIDAKEAGHYRSVPVFISGTDYIPPKAEEIPSKMAEGVEQLLSLNEHPVSLAARWHSLIANVHPFIDGNGRTARLMMNLVLMKHGFPVAIIPPIHRTRYLDCCSKGSQGDAGAFMTFFCGSGTAIRARLFADAGLGLERRKV